MKLKRSGRGPGTLLIVSLAIGLPLLTAAASVGLAYTRAKALRTSQQATPPSSGGQWGLPSIVPGIRLSVGVRITPTGQRALTINAF